MKYSGIYSLNPSVKSIIDDTAYDADGNVVEYDNDAAVAEGKLIALRKQRNALLALTDWWASSDLTMTAEQTAYRQALRDITDSYTSLDDVVWPTKPE
jgi:hypothetical protein